MRWHQAPHGEKVEVDLGTCRSDHYDEGRGYRRVVLCYYFLQRSGLVQQAVPLDNSRVVKIAMVTWSHCMAI